MSHFSIIISMFFVMLGLCLFFTNPRFKSFVISNAALITKKIKEILEFVVGVVAYLFLTVTPILFIHIGYIYLLPLVPITPEDSQLFLIAKIIYYTLLGGLQDFINSGDISPLLDLVYDRLFAWENLDLGLNALRSRGFTFFSFAYYLLSFSWFFHHEKQCYKTIVGQNYRFFKIEPINGYYLITEVKVKWVQEDS